MEPHVNAKQLLNHATTLKLHTGNLVNRSRLKKKCPSSPSEEHNILPPKALRIDSVESLRSSRHTITIPWLKDMIRLLPLMTSMTS
ncbi:hypothetical protein cypCar_00017789 [Cyprinus carpio]|nr:hypothetical protein cypCar_00017789 [Cyprinus carpio]